MILLVIKILRRNLKRKLNWRIISNIAIIKMIMLYVINVRKRVITPICVHNLPSVYFAYRMPIPTKTAHRKMSVINVIDVAT